MCQSLELQSVIRDWLLGLSMRSVYMEVWKMLGVSSLTTQIFTLGSMFQSLTMTETLIQTKSLRKPVSKLWCIWGLVNLERLVETLDTNVKSVSLETPLSHGSYQPTGTRKWIYSINNRTWIAADSGRQIESWAFSGHHIIAKTTRISVGDIWQIVESQLYNNSRWTQIYPLCNTCSTSRSRIQNKFRGVNPWCYRRNHTLLSSSTQSRVFMVDPRIWSSFSAQIISQSRGRPE